MKRFFYLIGLCLFTLTTNAQGPKNLTILDTLNIGQTLAGVWHYQHSSGAEYAIVGASEGICIVDISTPSSVSLLMQLPGVSSTWHEVKVLGDYAYAVSEGSDPNGLKNGLQIIDLRYLPDSAPNKFYQGDGAIAAQLITAHTVTVDGHTVFVNGHNIGTMGGGVLFLDVTDPWNPVYTGAITANYCHDSYVRDNKIYTSDIYAGWFSVYDISTLTTPVLQATQTTPGLFNHNTWLSDDGQYLFAADEKQNAPLASYNISNLGNISLLDTFYNGNFTSAEVHNVRVLNDYLICPSYGSQLTIVDGSRPQNMIEVANYTTGGYLCWDADPYTSSGNIIATDMTGIFYVFGPTYQRACYLEGLVTDSVTGITLNGVDVTITGTGITAHTNPLGKFYTGYADTGSYNVVFSKAGYNSKTLTFNFQTGVLDSAHVELVPVGTGLNDPLFTEFTIYPNPACDQIMINTSSKNYSYRIYDMNSKLVRESKMDEKNNLIATKDLSSGTYYIEFSDAGSVIKRKLIINR